jgi:hypothetical protein
MHLRLGLLLDLGLFLFLLLGLHDLLLMLSLQTCFFFFSLRHSFEKPFQSRLLSRLDILLQLLSSVSDTIFVETFLSHQEIDETFHIRSFPFEIAVWVVCFSHVRVQEEFSCFLIWPVVRDSVLILGIFLNRLDDFLKCAVLFDQLQRSVRADLGDGVDIITAKQDAKVDELDMSASSGI